MDKKRMTYFSVGFGILLVVVVALLARSSRREPAGIVLPDSPIDAEDLGMEHVESQLNVLAISPETVKPAIATLSRPVSYSRTQKVDAEKLEAAAALLREKNEKAPMVTTPWDQLTGAQLLSAMESGDTLASGLLAEVEEEACPACGGHHHHHDHECGHHHHEHEHGECCCHGHDHEEHHHEHHHDHDCACGHHHGHHHHHGHDADEVFTSWGVETTHTFTAEKLEGILAELDGERYGMVLRAKGIVPAPDGTWLHFDFVPGDRQVRTGGADYTGRLCVIGSKLDEDGLKALFEV